MKIIKKIYRKSRGISPVIATILLIGLTVIAGIAVALVMFGIVNTPDPLKVEVVGISNFETTDSDFLIDQFSVTLENKERTNVQIEPNAFLLSFINQTEITGWSLDTGEDTILLPALNSETFTLKCDSTSDQNELTPNNDSIFIDVTIFPEGSTNPRNAKTFKSDILKVGNTIGPVSLTPLLSTTDFGSGGLILNFSVSNIGSTDLNLVLEISASPNEDFYMTVNGENKTQYSFTITKYSTNTFPVGTFTVKPKTGAVAGLCLIGYSIGTQAIDVIELTYTG